MSCYKIYLASQLTVLIDGYFGCNPDTWNNWFDFIAHPEKFAHIGDILDNFVQYAFISKFITHSLGCELTLDI